MTPSPITIDFVSDVACPWCMVGVGALQQAIANLQGKVAVQLKYQPFELNPHMPVGGQDATEHLTEKYGITAEQIAQNQAQIRARAEAVGFAFSAEGRKRVYNTFNAHRLLYWAGQDLGLPAQQRLKKELLVSYFTLAADFDAKQTLLDAVQRADLDVARAQEILESDEFAETVRLAEQSYLQAGIRAVPAVILNNQYLIQGAQGVEVYEEALLKLSAASDGGD